MIRVVIESPFRGDNYEKTALFKEYVRKCMSDCFKRGEAPFASHALYTQEGVLDDKVAEERALGIEAGFLWGECADKVVVYTDYGITEGMQKGIDHAEKLGTPVEYRGIYDEEPIEEIILDALKREQDKAFDEMFVRELKSIQESTQLYRIKEFVWDDGSIVEDKRKTVVRGPIENVLVVRVPHADLHNLIMTGGLGGFMEETTKTIKSMGYKDEILFISERLGFARFERASEEELKSGGDSKEGV